MINQNFCCLRLRTSSFYLWFVILQLCLSIVTFMIVVFDPHHIKSPYVLAVQCILTVTMLIDIAIKCCSEDNFFSKRENVIDLVIVVMLILLVVIINLIQWNDKDSFIFISLEADDLITLLLLVFRYLTQIVRLLLLLKSSHQNIQVQRHTQDVDLKDVTKTDRSMDIEISYNIAKNREVSEGVLNQV